MEPETAIETATDGLSARRSVDRRMLPNVYAGAIPMEHLRMHPRFRPLPSPETVDLSSAHNYHLVQQDSDQWLQLRQGRITGARIAIFLGFFENPIAKRLQVPRNLRGHKAIVDLWAKMAGERESQREAGIVGTSRGSVADAAKAADPGSTSAIASAAIECDIASTSEDMWRATGTAYTYVQPVSSARPVLEPFHENGTRLVWGKIQEATGLLALLDFKIKSDPTVAMHEVGLCPSECVDIPSRFGIERRWLPRMGSSPDAVIVHDGGAVEAVEIKCSAPYYSVDTPAGSSLCIRDDGPYESVAPWHVPQLQLEIFCLGPSCTGCNFVSLSATRGANVFWVQRDDNYIAQMLRIIQALQRRYWEVAKLPPPQFTDGVPKYAGFIDETICLARRCPVVKCIPQAHLQRASGELIVPDPD